MEKENRRIGRPAKSALHSAWLFAFLWIFGCIDSSFYYPDDRVYHTPSDYGLDYKSVTFQSADGTRLRGWLIPALGTSYGTVLYFYGNFANRTYYLDHIHWFPRMGFNVFTFDYRGYGASEGSVDRSGLYMDSVAAIEYVQSSPDIDSSNLFIYAQSLGGVFAIAALAHNDFSGIRALAVESTFTSFRAEARYMMKQKTPKAIGRIPCLTWPIRPVTYLGLSNAYSPIDLVDRIAPVPLLIIHCASDTAVPFDHAEQLYEQANDPKYLWAVDGCEHVTLFTKWDHSDAYRQKLAAFFKSRGEAD
ncbi:MAG: alpha/beta hydrolase [Desulfococcaceae bacterium]